MCCDDDRRDATTTTFHTVSLSFFFVRKRRPTVPLFFSRTKQRDARFGFRDSVSVPSFLSAQPRARDRGVPSVGRFADCVGGTPTLEET